MTALAIAAIILVSPAGDPSELLPGFIEALSTGEGELALEMIAPEAISTIDSLLLSDPQRILSVTAMFGLSGIVPDSTADGEKLLLDIFGTPQVSMMLALVSVTPGPPFEHSGRTFIPVTWSILSQSNSVFVEAVPADGEANDWRILDFYTSDPRGNAVGPRSSRSTCSPV